MHVLELDCRYCLIDAVVYLPSRVYRRVKCQMLQMQANLVALLHGAVFSGINSSDRGR